MAVIVAANLLIVSKYQQQLAKQKGQKKLGTFQVILW